MRYQPLLREGVKFKYICAKFQQEIYNSKHRFATPFPKIGSRNHNLLINKNQSISKKHYKTYTQIRNF